jgi:hypothetical protein
MPEGTVTLRKSSKPSAKDLAGGKRLKIHRAAICSAAVRVAMSSSLRSR